MTPRSVRIAFDLQFRLCREADLPALEWLGLYAPHRQIIRETFARQQRGEALMLLGVANGYPLAQAWIDCTLHGPARCPRLWAVRVFPPLQGAGIGRELMHAAEALARSRGFERLELGVEYDNPGAHRFYVRLGYREVGSESVDVTYEFEGQPQCMRVDQRILRKELGAPPYDANTSTRRNVGRSTAPH